MVHKFEAGFTYRFPGGSEKQFIEPIQKELVALEQWTVKLEQLAASGDEVIIAEFPQSRYLPKLGKRSIRAAGVTSGYSDDVYGKSGMESQWSDLLTRIAKISKVTGWGR